MNRILVYARRLYDERNDARLSLRGTGFRQDNLANRTCIRLIGTTTLLVQRRVMNLMN